MNLNRLMKENVLQPEPIEHVASKRITDEDGEPLKFIIRPITSAEFDEIVAKNTAKVRNRKTGAVVSESIDSTAVSQDMILKSLVNPSLDDLENRKLQESWGVGSPIGVLKALLDPGEYIALLDAVQSLAGYDVAAVEETAKEVKKN